MCQAIVKPSGVIIRKRHLETSFRDNPHGAGYAYREKDGTVWYSKGFTSFKKFWLDYRKVQACEAIIHFRWATHGAKDDLNTHPFVVGNDAALIHNGILSDFLPSITDTRSDTRVFVEDFLNPTITRSGLGTAEFLASPITKSFLEKMIGSSKLAAISTAGSHIFNEKLGEWYEGAWYSAGKPVPRPRVAYGYSSADTDQWPMLRSYEEYSYQRYGIAVSDKEEPDTEDEDALAAGESSEPNTCVLCDRASDSRYCIGGDALCRHCWSGYMCDSGHLTTGY
jgi:hypothetical protein